jgi:formate dehydrogenase subunit gamma
VRQPPDTLVRYPVGTRINHWITAACFVLLLLSGLAMFDPAMFFLSSLFGSGQNTRTLHPWFGVVLFISFAVMFVRLWHHNLWDREDTRWVGAIKYLIENDEEHVPPVGRYNAGQKLVFWAMALLVLGLFLSGLVIWDEYFLPYTTIELKRIAVLIHALAAIGAIAVLIMHVYAGIWVRGSVRSMVRGYVTAGWAWRHHRKWLIEEAGHSSGGSLGSRHQTAIEP